MRQNRLLSFIVVIAIYAITIILGILIYNALNYHYLLNLLISDIACTVIVFIFSLIFKNASCYDPYWSVAPIVMVIALCLKSSLNTPIILATIVIVAWGLRLTINWACTFKGLNSEDWRYVMLREKTKKLYPLINFFGIHLFPTLVVYLCMIPVVSIFYNEANTNIFSYIFFGFAILSPLIEMIADMQMHKFRKQNTNTFIRIGLWKYSRHPNYLGEIMMWISMALLGISFLGFKWYYLIGACVNTLMFLFISIPMAENHQRSRKSGFEEYRRETRCLIPIKKFK